MLINSILVPTGIHRIDKILNGGIMTGNIYEICGPPSSGKTLLIMNIIKAFLRSDNNIYFLDSRQKLSIKTLKKLLNNEFKETSVSYPGWTKILILAALATVLGSSTPVGYNIGVINTPGYIIKQFCNESVHSRYNIVLDESQLDILWSSVVSIFLIGGSIGSLSGSILADKTGRKGGLTISSILGLIAGVLFWMSKTANSIEMLLIGRVFGGLSAGLITAIMPMYMMELAPPHLKGATGALCPLGVTLGILFGQILSMYNILGNEGGWPHCLAISAIFQFIYIVISFILPESPKYLFVIKEKPALALKELKRIRNVNEELLTGEIELLKFEEQENIRQGEHWSISRVVRSPELFLPLLLVCTLQAGQQLSGVNAVFYYSSVIFKSAGLSVKSSELATIGAGCCNMFMAIMSVQTMIWFKRRTILQISLVTSIIFLVILGISISYMDKYQFMPYLCIVSVLGYVLCYGLGLGPIPYFIGSELFEVGARSSAMAIGSMANWSGNFVVGITFPTMAAYIGAPSFYIFASIVIAILIFIRTYLPETKGKEACEIYSLVANGLKSKPLEPSRNIKEINTITNEKDTI
ncbi:solute carrier family 2, facilitated glucose transporter member 5-like isoform X2 [Rhynchophorus ferrugineus]